MAEEQDTWETGSTAMSVDSSPYHSPKLSASDTDIKGRKEKGTIHSYGIGRDQETTGQSDQLSPLRGSKQIRASPSGEIAPEAHKENNGHHAVHPTRLRVIDDTGNAVSSAITSDHPSFPSRPPQTDVLTKRLKGEPQSRTPEIEKRAQEVKDTLKILSRSDDTDHPTTAQLHFVLLSQSTALQESVSRAHSSVHAQLLAYAATKVVAARACIAKFERCSPSEYQGNSCIQAYLAKSSEGNSYTPVNSAVLNMSMHEPPRKRRRLSENDLITEELTQSRSVGYSGTISNSPSNDSTATLGSIAPFDEIEDFLNDLSDSIYHIVLANLCPYNMRGSFCKTPEECIEQARYFACPEYAAQNTLSKDARFTIMLAVSGSTRMGDLAELKWCIFM